MVTVNVIWNNTLEKLILHKIDVCLCATKNDPKPLLSWIVYRSQVCNLYSGWRWNGASRTFLSVWIMWIIKWSFSFLEGNRATQKNCYIENTYRELIEKFFLEKFIHCMGSIYSRLRWNDNVETAKRMVSLKKEQDQFVLSVNIYFLM